MQSKQLELHEDKTGFLIMGEKKKVESIKKEIASNPLTVGGFITKEREKEKWLGEYLHRDGLDASIKATVISRSGKVKAAIF